MKKWLIHAHGVIDIDASVPLNLAKNTKLNLWGSVGLPMRDLAAELICTNLMKMKGRVDNATLLDQLQITRVDLDALTMRLNDSAINALSTMMSDNNFDDLIDSEDMDDFIDQLCEQNNGEDYPIVGLTKEKIEDCIVKHYQEKFDDLSNDIQDIVEKLIENDYTYKKLIEEISKELIKDENIIFADELYEKSSIKNIKQIQKEYSDGDMVNLCLDISGGPDERFSNLKSGVYVFNDKDKIWSKVSNAELERHFLLEAFDLNDIMNYINQHGGGHVHVVSCQISEDYTLHNQVTYKDKENIEALIKKNISNITFSDDEVKNSKNLSDREMNKEEMKNPQIGYNYFLYHNLKRRKNQSESSQDTNDTSFPNPLTKRIKT